MFMIRMSMRLYLKTNEEIAMKNKILLVLGIIVVLIVLFYFVLFLTA